MCKKILQTTSFGTVLLNFYDFRNIKVSQGSAATYLRHDGIYNANFVAKILC